MVGRDYQAVPDGLACRRCGVSAERQSLPYTIIATALKGEYIRSVIIVFTTLLRDRRK
jgi:hypothetical protein